LSNTITIKNCKVVNEGQITEKDLIIKNGRFEKIGNDLASEGETIDAAGLFLFPGIIDDQCHFREPGLTERGSIKTESLSAVAGGTTSFMDMPNVIPPTLSLDLWRDKISIAEKTASANFSFYMGTSNTNIDEIKAIDPKEVCGIKIFMGSSTGNLHVDSEDALNDLFRESPVIITTHCEDDPMIKAKEQEFLAKYGEKIPVEMHSEIRSREACLKSSKKAIDLAERYGANLHILHLTTKEEVELFSNKPLNEKMITAEVCIPHLYFSRDDYATKGTLIKCNPSIKETADRDALRAGLLEGYIDYVATDHAPHQLEGKSNDYMDCPSGIPSVQHTLLVLLELVREGVYSLDDLPYYLSHKVADRFKIIDRGYIREGYWADCVLVDLEHQHKITKENTSYFCGWSPFEGDTFNSKVISTFVNGTHAYNEGKILETNLGMQLEFDR
jgi:dihydroorotase|tara:strand:- start:3093 stop:4424 length:1332 start_codon:yes stop_codon:yes gene_type:complete